MATTAPHIVISSIPEELRELRQWVNYQLTWNEARGHYDKKPYNARTGALASSTDAATWATFDAVMANYRAGKFSGIGFVFTQDDPYAGIDLDGCYDVASDSVADWADAVLRQFESYSEVSPSETGVHIIIRGTLPGGGRSQHPYEAYDQGRFFTFTGQILDGRDVIQERSGELEDFCKQHFPERTSYHVETDPDLIERAKAAANGDKFTRVWSGDNSDYNGDASAGDLGLAQMLLFWTQGDTLRTDTLFRQSSRMRQKWDERHYSDGTTYGQHTIATAWEVWRQERGAAWSAPLEMLPESELPQITSAAIFPMDALPEVVRKFAADWAAVLSTVPEAVAIPCLAFASGALGRTRTLRVTSRFSVSALLWVGIIGEPGSAKSAALEEAGRWLSHRDIEMFKTWESEMEDHRWRLSQLKKGQRPDDPPRRCHRVIGDATTEAVGKVLHEDDHGVVMVHDELAGWISAFNQYRAKGTGSDRQRFIAIWSGGELRVDRVREDGSYVVPHPFMAVCGGIQPDMLGTLTNELGNDGFLARFLFASIPLLPSVGIEEPNLSPEPITRWNETIDAILSWVTGELIHFTPSGAQAWKRGSAAWAALMNDPDFDPRLRSFHAKGHLLSARLALVLHCIKEASGEVDEPAVDEQTAESAWKLMAYFASTMRYVVLRIAETETDKQVDRIVEYVKSHGGKMTVREALQVHLAGLKSSKALEEAFKSVQDHGRGTVASEAVPGGRRVTLTCYT